MKSVLALVLFLVLTALFCTIIVALWKTIATKLVQRQTAPTPKETTSTATTKPNFFATFGTVLNTYFAQRFRIANEVRETKAHAEQLRIANPHFIPPAPLQEQLLRFADKTLEALFLSLGKWVRTWRRVLTPLRVVKWQRRRERARERAAQISTQPNVPFWKLRDFQLKALFWCAIIVSLFLGPRHFWAGLTLFTVTLSVTATWWLYKKHQSTREIANEPANENTPTQTRPALPAFTKIIASIGVPCVLCGIIFPKLGLLGAEILFLLIVRWVWIKWRACENFVFRPLLMGLFVFTTFIWVATICTHVGSELKWQTSKTTNAPTNNPLPYR